jgi:antitoxin (DNA-binding transcriptional repressor) of toxin-antitoxin stability system
MTNNTIEVANANLLVLLEKVEQGEEVTLTRNGQAIAQLISTNHDHQRQDLSEKEPTEAEMKAIDDEKFRELCKTYAAVA